MAHFILVHGMFHGGWCWDRLARRLVADGHSVDAPDLASCGTDRTPPQSATLNVWAANIAALVDKADSRPILVGHSRGGMVISQAAEQASEKIAALVYLAALMLPDGASARDLPQIVAESGFAHEAPLVAMRLNEAGTAMLPPENAGDLFYGGCSAQDRAWAEPQMGHEPLSPLATSLSLTQERWGRIPRVYIATAGDRTLPINNQRAMVARTGVAKMYSLEADHMPILSHVNAIAAILGEVASQYADMSSRVTA